MALAAAADGHTPATTRASRPACAPQPLVREGRMDTFLFEPTREEMAGALRALFAPQLGSSGVDALLDAFPCQPMDFFGAIRSRLVDAAVRRWLRDTEGSGQVRAWRELSRG